MGEHYPVYVVDDDPDIRDWLQAYCEESGFACHAFAGGDEFIAALDELEPGCVLLDMRMPRTDGLKVQEELARRGSALPVIAMTGYGDVELAVQSMRLGAVDFLEKPFDLEVLREALDQACRRIAAP